MGRCGRPDSVSAGLEEAKQVSDNPDSGGAEQQGRGKRRVHGRLGLHE